MKLSWVIARLFHRSISIRQFIARMAGGIVFQRERFCEIAAGSSFCFIFSFLSFFLHSAVRFMASCFNGYGDVGRKEDAGYLLI